MSKKAEKHIQRLEEMVLSYERAISDMGFRYIKRYAEAILEAYKDEDTLNQISALLDLAETLSKQKEQFDLNILVGG